MTPANQEVLDETYQELLKELNEANIRLEKANSVITVPLLLVPLDFSQQVFAF